MRILIIGASKGIGKQTVLAALAAGHHVTAFARHPELLHITEPKLTMVAGDVMDPQSVAGVIAGHDVVICTLGLPTRQAIGPPFAARSYVLSHGTANVIAAMQTAGVKRLLCVTAIGAGGTGGDCTPFARLALRLGLRWLFSEKDAQEKHIRASQLDWTIIHPTALANRSRETATTRPAKLPGLFSYVSRTDVARTMIGIVGRPDSFGQVVVVTNPPRRGDGLRWAVNR